MSETALEIKQPTTPDQLLALAVDKDLDIEKLSKLMELQRQWKEGLAREAFFNALVEFQANCPELRKSKTVSFSAGGGKTEYKYAPLADIIRQIKPVIKSVDIAYRWEIADNGESIIVTCLVTHKDGHTERTTMSAKADTSGSKNAIQARGSAIEYLKRYTLIGALGISTADSDVDGSMPEIDIDLLHKQYMIHYGELIQIDSKYSKWAPENWRAAPTAKVYATAIGEIRKKLAELTPRQA
jgi:hypothetical protein